MRHYLSTLHTRSDTHKKRFAFLVSGGFTLVIFSLWSLATFGTGGTLTEERVVVVEKETVQEVSPFASLREGLASGWEGLKEAFEGLSGGLQGAADSQPQNVQFPEDVLNIYGR